MLSVGGLGEVCTAESQRGQGLAAAVIQDAIQHMQAMGTDLSLLHTSKPALQQYYARLGYFNVEMAFLQAQLLEKGPAARRARAGISVLDADSSAAPPWPALAAAHAATAARHGWQGYVQRSGAYWEQWIAGEVSQGTNRLAWTAAGDGVAYMATSLAVRGTDAGEQ